MNEPQSETSWTGQGTGTDRKAFFRKMFERLPEDADHAYVQALGGALVERLSSGTARRLVESLPVDLRPLFAATPEHRGVKKGEGRKSDFYLEVAEQLNVNPDEVRRLLHAFFAALHGQITDQLAHSIASELPVDLTGTFIDARRVADRPA
jgi:uncharacterized protein (DUF2267 family)